MESSSEPLALIAGSSQMPSIVAREAQARGHRVTALAIRGITDEEVAEAADEVLWLEWGDVGAFLQVVGDLRDAGIRQAVMAGKVEQKRIYESGGGKGLRALLASLPIRHTDALIKTAANVLAGSGIELLNCSDFLSDYLAPSGSLCERSPDEREVADIDHGWEIAKALGGLDIGQTVVVKERAVVALEAMEGTDACIRRAGELAGPGTVVVKVAKPKQDLRFDLPVIGYGTVESMLAAGATALAIQAGSTVIFDHDRIRAAADTAGIAVVAR
jgi:DUF1009 family protein